MIPADPTLLAAGIAGLAAIGAALAGYARRLLLVVGAVAALGAVTLAVLGGVP